MARALLAAAVCGLVACAPAQARPWLSKHDAQHAIRAYGAGYGTGTFTLGRCHRLRRERVACHGNLDNASGFFEGAIGDWSLPLQAWVSNHHIWVKSDITVPQRIR